SQPGWSVSEIRGLSCRGDCSRISLRSMRATNAPTVAPCRGTSPEPPLLPRALPCAYHPPSGDGRVQRTTMIYQQVINGLMLGASYALVAIGYTLIFGVLGLLYFAHGEVFMVGAFVGLYLVLHAGANIWLALVGAMIACGALGIAAFYVAVRPGAK